MTGTAERLYTAADLDAARVAGRREADDAIMWDTTCIGCAGRLTDLYAERCAGNLEAAQRIEAALRAAFAETGDRTLLHAVAIARAYAGRPDGAAPQTRLDQRIQWTRLGEVVL